MVIDSLGCMYEYTKFDVCQVKDFQDIEQSVYNISMYSFLLPIDLIDSLGCINVPSLMSFNQRVYKILSVYSHAEV
jgi:hypothetical protein